MRGMTLIELMVALTISSFILLALLALFVNMSRSTSEFKKSNDMIENGRFALQALANELEHAGYWGGYIPQFDNLTWIDEPPLDTPTAIPDPCAEYANWTTADRLNLIGLPIVSYDTLPTGAGCVGFGGLGQKVEKVGPTPKSGPNAGTDVVVIRYLERCLPGAANCPADTAGAVYMQFSQCALELAGTAQAGGSASTIVLASNMHNDTINNVLSTNDNTYAGAMLRITGGTGAGQIRWVSGYVGATTTATVTPNWAVTPDATSTYALDYTLGTQAWPLHTRLCTGTGTPPALPITGGPVAGKRRFLSSLYYIHEFPHPENAGEVIPTLMRSSFELSGGTNAHQAPVALVEGIEAMRVELGIDDISDSGDAVDNSAELVWQNPNVYDTPTNRGDGAADEYKRCTTGVPCTVAELSNVVSAKIYVLVRSRDQTPEYTDTRTYCLGEFAANGTCPADNTIGAANDNYQRHVYTRSVRIVNVSARRETP